MAARNVDVSANSRQSDDKVARAGSPPMIRNFPERTPAMPSRSWTLAVVAMATAMLMLDIAVVNTALGHIATDLHTGLSGLQWVVDAYTLALASTVLSAGFVADRIGRRRVFTLGLALFT